jgi:hypothetical protein
MLSVRLTATRTIKLVSLHIQPFHAKCAERAHIPVTDQILNVAQAVFVVRDPSPTPIWVGPHNGWDNSVCVGLFESTTVASDPFD